MATFLYQCFFLGETCVDVDADCPLQVAAGKCQTDERVQRRCRKSCGICVTECWDTADDCKDRKVIWTVAKQKRMTNTRTGR